MLQSLQSIDLWLFEALTPWNAPWLDRLMSWISISGTASSTWLVLASVAMMRRSSRAGAWRVYLTVLLCYLTVDLVWKPLIARQRPASIRAYEPARVRPPMPRTASFPSGHSAAAFGSAVAISRVWPHARVAWWTLAFVMGYSRVYLGHHYPLDVACGALWGIAIALWVLGGRHPATYANTLPKPPPPGVVVRP